MLTKEMIVLESEKTGSIQYDWSRSFKTNSSYDLFLTIGNCGYRIASYSLKTKRIILYCPEIHIPQSYALEKFIEYVKKKEKI